MNYQNLAEIEELHNQIERKNGEDFIERKFGARALKSNVMNCEID